MKLRDLISIAQQDWVVGFLNTLRESGGKKARAFESLANGLSDENVLEKVYGNLSDKTRKTFNQTASTLYKEFLTYLLIQHREYPDVMMADLRRLLAKADEKEFLRRADVVERVFVDCEAFDHQISFYHLVQDHHFQNKYKAALYREYTAKLRAALKHASDYHSIEEYYLNEDLALKGKRGKWEQEKLDRHNEYYKAFFESDQPFKTQIRSRLFWLKTLKINNYFNLSSEDSQRLSEEAFDVLRKRPFLYFNLPEVAEFTNISYRLYSAFEVMNPHEANDLFNSYFEKHDDENLIALYPRVVQAMITTQVRYYGGKAGLRFVDDPKPMDAEIEKGLLGLLPMVKRIRNRPNFIEKGDRLYGLETEALIRQHLPGENRMESARLFEHIRVQEQQMQHVMGSHMIHVNLIHCYFWAKQWAELMEEIEKYKRFIKAKGELNPLISQILVFSEMIAKVMLREIEMTPTEIEARGKEIFKDHPKWHQDMAVYTIQHLKLVD